MEIVRRELREFASRKKARVLQGFFKTGKGEYGEGDVFLGVSVPNVRKIVKGAAGRFSLDDVQELLDSGIHEERLAGVLILVDRYERGDEDDRKEAFDFYLNNAARVNNWDLVDLSAWKIVGRFLLNKDDRGVLNRLAVSENLWERRIGIVSTFAFIREGEIEDALRVSRILIGDDHDLIHKAVGWMLREVGKRNREKLEGFLRENYDELARTTLRYAIERFPEDLRKEWLLGNI